MRLEWIEAGEIVTTHGVRGEVKVLCWLDDPEYLVDFERVRVGGKDYAVKSCRVQKTCNLMALEGVDTIEDAAKLRDKELCLCREDVELEEGTVFIADLIGLPVLADGREIGKITEVMTPPGNDVYVVKGSHEYMIPAVKEFVEEINVQEGYVKVRLIEGMQTDAD